MAAARANQPGIASFFNVSFAKKAKKADKEGGNDESTPSNIVTMIIAEILDNVFPESAYASATEIAASLIDEILGKVVPPRLEGVNAPRGVTKGKIEEWKRKFPWLSVTAGDDGAPPMRLVLYWYSKESVIRRRDGRGRGKADSGSKEWE